MASVLMTPACVNIEDEKSSDESDGLLLRRRRLGRRRAVVGAPQEPISEPPVAKRARSSKVCASSGSEADAAEVVPSDRASPTTTEMPGLAQLVDMGFSFCDAQVALVAAQGELSVAIETLTERACVHSAAVSQDSSASRAVASTCRERTEVKHLRMQPTPSSESASRRSGLKQLSQDAKAAVLRALAGPNEKRASNVDGSIRRGRVAMSKNWWHDSSDDARLVKLSPAYERLKSYQQVGVRWMLGLAEAGIGGILADEMGLGKTAEALVYLDLLPHFSSVSSACVMPSLVIVPASVMSSWEAECERWCPHFRPFRYHSSVGRNELAEKYFREYDGKCSLILTTAAMLHNKADRAMFFRRIRYKCVVVDEAHCMRNASSMKFRDVQRGLDTQHRLFLTGTPVQNSLRELVNMLTLLLAPTCGDPRGKKHSHALDELAEVADRGSLKTIQARAAPLILRRLKRDVMSELPPKEVHTVRCALTPTQKTLYDRDLAAARGKSAVSGQASSRARAEFVRSLFHRLRRVCSHPLLGQSRLEETDYVKLMQLLRTVRPDIRQCSDAKALAEIRSWSDYDVCSAVREYGFGPRLGDRRQRFEASRSDIVDGSTKIVALLNLLQAQREKKMKTLVFSQFTQFLNLIGDALVWNHIRFARLDGGTKVDERPQIINTFMDQDSGVDVFLLSTKAGGTGLTLTVADTVVLMDLCFNPQDNRQAEDRVHRLGQARPVHIHYFVCEGTIEEDVLQMNLKKSVLDYQFGGERLQLEALDQQTPYARDGDEDAGDEDEADDGKDAEQKLLASLAGLCNL